MSHIFFLQRISKFSSEPSLECPFCRPVRGNRNEECPPNDFVIAGIRYYFCTGCFTPRLERLKNIGLGINPISPANVGTNLERPYLVKREPLPLLSFGIMALLTVMDPCCYNTCYPVVQSNLNRPRSLLGVAYCLCLSTLYHKQRPHLYGCLRFLKDICIGETTGGVNGNYSIHA